MTTPIICVFDLETTGLPAEADKIAIVQLAAVLLNTREPGWPEMGVFNRCVTPDLTAYRSPVAMAMHRKKGRDEDYFAEFGFHPATAYAQFELWLKEHAGDEEVILAGHNAAAFDVPLLARDMCRWGFDLTGQKGRRLADHHIIDTAVLAFDRYGILGTGDLKSVSLKPLALHLGLAVDDAATHDALYDVRLTAQVLRVLKGEATHA